MRKCGIRQDERMGKKNTKSLDNPPANGIGGILRYGYMIFISKFSKFNIQGEVSRMDITPRRIAQLQAEGVDAEKIGNKWNSILKNLADEGYTLYEVEILISMMSSRLEEMKQRKPETRISEII